MWSMRSENANWRAASRLAQGRLPWWNPIWAMAGHMYEHGMMPQGCAEAEGLKLGAVTSVDWPGRDHNSEPQIGTNNWQGRNDIMAKYRTACWHRELWGEEHLAHPARVNPPSLSLISWCHIGNVLVPVSLEILLYFPGGHGNRRYFTNQPGLQIRPLNVRQKVTLTLGILETTVLTHRTSQLNLSRVTLANEKSVPACATYSAVSFWLEHRQMLQYGTVDSALRSSLCGSKTAQEAFSFVSIC